MKEKIVNSISKLLEKAALDLAEQPGCRFLWGEVIKMFLELESRMVA